MKKDKLEASKAIGIKISNELWKKLRIFAIEHDKTATEIMQNAMKEYLENHKEKK